MKNKRLKDRIQERITTLSTIGQIPADEVQLNLDVAYNSILDEILSVVPMESPRQIISSLVLRYGSEGKEINDDRKDVVDSILMSAVGSFPLDEYGYPTNTVNFESNSKEFFGKYQNVFPGTVNINNKIFDDSLGNLIDSTKDNAIVGTVDYVSAKFELNDVSETTFNVKYQFGINEIPVNDNAVYFQKKFLEIFAEMYKLDLDTALVLNDVKSIKIKDNIKNILPDVLAHQIDSQILSRYFKQLDLNSTHKVSWDASVDWTYAEGKPTITRKYRDLGSLVALEMAQFTKRTGVYPNVIICDSMSFGILSASNRFKPVDKTEDVDYSGVPRKVGYFNGVAKVFVTNVMNSVENQGRIVLTYKGPSEAQAAAVYTPFIPVTLRTVQGAENNMVITNNAYSMAGFAITNSDLISGIYVNNINLPE